MFKWIGQIAIWFLDWVQSWAFNGLIAISPVLLGALALPWTQGVGITFLTTSFGIAAWHLGISLVDILLASVATQLFASVGIGGGVAAATVISVGALPIFLGALAAIVCVSIALYLAVPIIIAAVLRGSSPLTTGAKAGIEMTLSALGTASLAGSRLAAHQAAAAPKSGDARTSDARRSEGDAEGGAGESAPVSPFPRPSGSSTFSGGMARGKSRATEAETSGDASTAISAEQRQTQILAEYDEAGGGVSTQRSTRNPLKRRKSEGERLLAERDETYT